MKIMLAVLEVVFPHISVSHSFLVHKPVKQ